MSQNILNCSFPLWFANFSEHTIDSTVIKIPPVVIEYLLADRLFLPDGDIESCQLGSNFTDSSLIDESYTPTEEETKFKKLFMTDEFVDFQSLVVSTIAELGGKVFPKLNWSAPNDASWIAVNGILCCQNFNDVCLLLKSSEYITHDLTDPFLLSEHMNTESSQTSSIEYVLVLRKWTEISPSGEYRCFIRHNKLFAISQRSTQHFSFIEDSKAMIVRSINRFFKNVVRHKFPNSSYVLDLYLSEDNGKPTIIDFNPFVSVTDSLLFSWDELQDEVPLPEVATGELTRGIVFRSVPTEGMFAQFVNAYKQISKRDQISKTGIHIQ